MPEYSEFVLNVINIHLSRSGLPLIRVDTVAPPQFSYIVRYNELIQEHNQHLWRSVVKSLLTIVEIEGASQRLEWIEVFGDC